MTQVAFEDTGCGGPGMAHGSNGVFQHGDQHGAKHVWKGGHDVAKEIRPIHIARSVAEPDVAELGDRVDDKTDDELASSMA